MKNNKLSSKEEENMIKILSERFHINMDSHKDLHWDKIEAKLLDNPHKLWSLNEMEKTGGEPNLIDYDESVDEYIFCDCSQESPAERRSLCYDEKALASRKENKPRGSASGQAREMGIEMIDEETYRKLQELIKVDLKTSSWIKTPEKIRELGGALFGDRRYDNVFVYHNGAESYYSARGFRGILKV